MIHRYKPGEPIVVRNLRITWYGNTNIGKSTLALSTKRPVLFDFDTGAHRAVRNSADGEVIRIDSWDDMVAILNDKNFFNDFDTVVLDTVSKCMDYMTAYIIKNDPKMGKGGALNQAGWGKLGMMFNLFTMQIIGFGKDLLMLAQAREKDKDESTQIRIRASGQQKDLIPENSDFVGYLHSRGDDRVIAYQFTDDYYAKDVKKTMGLIKIPEVKDRPLFGADMIAQMKTAFAMAAKVEAEKVQAIQEWADTISGFTTVDEFNRILPELEQIRASNPGMYSQVGGYVRTRREKLGIVYDNEAKVFKMNGAPKKEEPKQETPPQEQPKQEESTQQAAPVETPQQSTQVETPVQATKEAQLQPEW